MTDKQIIKKFSDNHCLVLENNQVSLREDEITAYRIVLGKSTNELLEFVKDTYLQLKAKEQECDGLTADTVYLRDRVGKLERAILRRNEQLDKLKQTLTEIKPILELYANSKIGEEQLGGIYKITVKDLKVLGGSYIAFYDPRPAKQALQKINEYEVKND